MTTSMVIEASHSATSRELCRALDALQFPVSVKGHKVLAVHQRLPGGVTQIPPDLKLQISTIPAMAEDFVNEPFLVIVCSKVIGFGLNSVGKQGVIGCIVGTQ